MSYGTVSRFSSRSAAIVIKDTEKKPDSRRRSADEYKVFTGEDARILFAKEKENVITVGVVCARFGVGNYRRSRAKQPQITVEEATRAIENLEWLNSFLKCDSLSDAIEKIEETVTEAEVITSRYSSDVLSRTIYETEIKMECYFHL